MVTLLICSTALFASFLTTYLIVNQNYIPSKEKQYIFLCLILFRYDLNLPSVSIIFLVQMFFHHSGTCRLIGHIETFYSKPTINACKAGYWIRSRKKTLILSTKSCVYWLDDPWNGIILSIEYIEYIIGSQMLFDFLCPIPI